MPLHRDITMTQEFKQSVAAATANCNDGRKLRDRTKQPPKNPSLKKAPPALPPQVPLKKKRGRPPGKSKKKEAQRKRRDHYQSSQSTHSSFYVSESDSTFEKDRPLIELGRRRRQRKKEKKHSKKRKRKLLASPIQSSDDSDVPLSSLLRRSHSPNGRRANLVDDDDVVYHNDSLLEIARKTRLSQASSPHKSKYHIIPVDTKTPADRLVRRAPLDGDFTISKILANMRNDVSLYGNDSDRANYIQQLDINSKAYEGTF